MLVTNPNGTQCITRKISVLIWRAVKSRMMCLTLHRKISDDIKRYTSGIFIKME